MVERVQKQIRSVARGLLGQRMSTDYFFLVWRSMVKAIGEAYPETLW
jgi:hypothetical protein